MIEYNDKVILISLPSFNERRLTRFIAVYNDLKFGGTIVEEPDNCIVHYNTSNGKTISEFKVPLNIVELKPEPKNRWS